MCEHDLVHKPKPKSTVSSILAHRLTYSVYWNSSTIPILFSAGSLFRLEQNPGRQRFCFPGPYVFAFTAWTCRPLRIPQAKSTAAVTALEFFAFHFASDIIISQSIMCAELQVIAGIQLIDSSFPNRFRFLYLFTTSSVEHLILNPETSFAILLVCDLQSRICDLPFLFESQYTEIPRRVVVSVPEWRPRRPVRV